MGKEMLLREATEEYRSGSSQQPVIIACTNPVMVSQTFPDWPWLNLGLMLSEEILAINKADRPRQITSFVQRIVDSFAGGQIVIDNIDMLFAPYYKLDVLKLFEQIGRRKRLIVMWEGAYDNGKLTYAAPELADYHSYEIKDYDVFIITR